MMLATKNLKLAVIIATAEGHISAVTPAFGSYTFVGDLRGEEHAALCQKAADHVKNSSVLNPFDENAFTVKDAPITLVEAPARPARRAVTAAAAAADVDDAATAAAADAAAAAAAARRTSTKKATPRTARHDEGGGKRAVQPLAAGDYVRRDDGSVSKIVTSSTKAGWSKTASGRKAKRGEGSVLMEPQLGLEAYQERLKEVRSAEQLRNMSGELKEMQKKIDEAIAARLAAETRADASAARLEVARKAEADAEAARVAAPALGAHLVDLVGPPPGGGAAAAAAAAAAQLNAGGSRHSSAGSAGALAQLLAQHQGQPPQQPPQQPPLQQAFLAQLLANERLSAAHDRNQSNLMMMAMFMNGGR